MKKFSILFIALATLPFSTSHCLTKNQTIGIGCVAAVAVAGGTYYYYNKTPNNTNNSTGITPVQQVIIGSDEKTPASEPTNNTQTDAPKHSIITPPAQDNNKPTEESTTKTEPGFLDSFRTAKTKLKKTLQEYMGNSKD